MARKWPDSLYIPYFQARTSTYAPTERLRALYMEALDAPGVVGLAIATRPDCLPEPVCDLLEELSRRTYLCVELGLQTIHDRTATAFGRGYPYAQFLRGYHRLRERGILTGVHLIHGLPGESREEMLDSVRAIAELAPHMVKLHLLYYSEGSRYGADYLAGKLAPMEQADYVALVCDSLERLPPEVIIGRLTGDGAPESLLAPTWSSKKLVVLNEIDKELARRASMQGKNYAAP